MIKHDERYPYESEELEEMMVLTIPLEDGTNLECEVLAIFPVKLSEQDTEETERQYIALLPLAEGEASDSLNAEDILLYRFTPVGAEEFNLDDIEEDDEYEIVADAFDMLLDEAMFDSMLEDTEE